MPRTGRPKGQMASTIALRNRVLAATEAETLHNLSKDPRVGVSLDLRVLDIRRDFGATIPKMKSRIGGVSRERVENRLHELKNLGLVEYYMAPEHVVRWFPVSLIPKY